jgi:hypothetical protein
VIGRSHVVVYDNQHGIPPTGGFYFLAPGDRYDLLSREVWRPAQPTPMPVGRVENPVTP